MEHPVPQNVTSFEFHLIGDMTLRQFGYLAVGMVIAYLTFVLFFSSVPILASPVILISALAGIAYAFLPILDRPLDHWTKAFFKAVYSPTQGKWKNETLAKFKDVSIEPLFKNRLNIYLSSHAAINLPPEPTLPIPVPTPPAPLRRLEVPPKVTTPPPPPTQKAPLVEDIPTLSPLPSSDELNKLVAMAKDAQTLQANINETEKQINELKVTTTQGKYPVPQERIQKAAENLQTLIQQAENLHHQTEEVKKDLPVRPKRTPAIVVEPLKPTQTQVLLTSSPNVINGIVTDTAGNYLEGVIAIIHNEDGIPVRALKTNKLGQFTGATPLPSGTYTLTLEKENLEFDTLQITLSNEVLSPISIQAKRGGLPG